MFPLFTYCLGLHLSVISLPCSQVHSTFVGKNALLSSLGVTFLVIYSPNCVCPFPGMSALTVSENFFSILFWQVESSCLSILILGYKQAHLGGSTCIYAYLNNAEERVYFSVLSACHVYLVSKLNCICFIAGSAVSIHSIFYVTFMSANCWSLVCASNCGFMLQVTLTVNVFEMLPFALLCEIVHESTSSLPLQ